jgi:phosphatidylserine/phosphatidylglycerophosphate/cardiolipin synthase-like enzyme
MGRGNHRKALIVDGRECILGSRNLHRFYFDPLQV